MMFKTVEEETKFISNLTQKWMDMLEKLTNEKYYGDDIVNAQYELLEKYNIPLDAYNKTFMKYYNKEWSFKDNIQHWMFNHFDVMYQDEIEYK